VTAVQAQRVLDFAEHQRLGHAVVHGDLVLPVGDGRPAARPRGPSWRRPGLVAGRPASPRAPPPTPASAEC
jgi:hypothetical protein